MLAIQFRFVTLPPIDFAPNLTVARANYLCFRPTCNIDFDCKNLIGFFILSGCRLESCSNVCIICILDLFVAIVDVHTKYEEKRFQRANLVSKTSGDCHATGLLQTYNDYDGWFVG